MTCKGSALVSARKRSSNGRSFSSAGGGRHKACSRLTGHQALDPAPQLTWKPEVGRRRDQSSRASLGHPFCFQISSSKKHESAVSSKSSLQPAGGFSVNVRAIPAFPLTFR